MNETNPIQLSCFFVNINLEQTKDSYITSILTCILNAVFSVLTVTANLIILRVIWMKQELHSPSFILLACLASSDVLVGLICQPLYVANHITGLTDDLKMYCVLGVIWNISSWTTSGVSLTILGLVCVDRLLALTLHLRYNTIVTVRKIFQTVFFVWIFVLTAVILRIWIVSNRWLFAPLLLFLLTFLVITICTIKIFHIVRRHQRQISQQQQSVQFNTVNVLKCRKSAVTVLYVYCLFLVFYVPFFVTMLVGEFSGNTLSLKIAYNYVTTIDYLNSLLNPLVYCWRIKEIRGAIKKTLGKN